MLTCYNAHVRMHIHEPYRAKLIPEYQQAKQLAESEYGTMYISGSGSTLMAIMPNQQAAS